MTCRFIVYPAAGFMDAVSVVTLLHYGIDFRGLFFEIFFPSCAVLFFPSLTTDFPALLPFFCVPLGRRWKQEMLRGYKILLSDSALFERDQALRL